jgi:hypothetical protein
MYFVVDTLAALARLTHPRRCGCRLEAHDNPRCNQYDLGRPRTCSAKKLRIRFVEIGAT